MIDRDWEILLNSETFRNYLNTELEKEAKIIQPNLEQELGEFVAFEQQVNENPRLKSVFAALKNKFETDIAYAEQCNPLFVEAVLALELGK